MPVELISVLREFDLLEKSTPEHENFVFDSYAYAPESGLTKFNRRIEDTRRQRLNSTIHCNDADAVGTGEDPRAFFWRGSPCISALTAPPGHEFINKIYILNEDRWLTLVTPKGLAPGKNWSPLVLEGELYFIHGFSPFRLLKARHLHPNDPFLLVDIAEELPIKTPNSTDGFSNLRGGSNAVQLGDWIFGAGHTNDRRNRRDHLTMVHRPFFYVYLPGQSLTYYECAFDFPDRYHLVDPTSLYIRDGRLNLITCETERVWGHTPQKGRICLYQMDIPGDCNENSLGFGGRRLHRWTHGQPSQIRRLLGARR